MWMPLKKSTKLMTRSLVQDMITCLSMFPSKNGISSNLSPSAIILGSPNTDHNNLKTTLGAYSQVYIGNTNSIKQRTIGAIKLRLEK